MGTTVIYTPAYFILLEFLRSNESTISRIVLYLYVTGRFFPFFPDKLSSYLILGSPGT